MICITFMMEGTIFRTIKNNFMEGLPWIKNDSQQPYRLEEAMKKGTLPILLLFSVVLFANLAACVSGKNNEDNGILPIYIPYDELPEDYSEEAAQLDGCVVIESESVFGQSFQYVEEILKKSTPISGDGLWNNFLESVENGETVKIRIVYYFVPPVLEGEALWEEEKSRVFDLSYDDGAYFLHYEKDGKEITEKYAMLKCFEGDYFEKEWVLLKESFLDAEYKELLKVSPFSSYIAINPNFYHLIYFSDGETTTPQQPQKGGYE